MNRLSFLEANDLLAQGNCARSMPSSSANYPGISTCNDDSKSRQIATSISTQSLVPSTSSREAPQLRGSAQHVSHPHRSFPRASYHTYRR
ncbi:hypothetical protein BU24DRAFT_80986 [Aaosphaeria arxii CBS 175.79]|uniref:Uncharacterized protein n=1 Tax=Aaosphaeria arxii CBS 175.79 TaxID=1450172 RepID=A0A6A5XA96_9PLEO|nr:uncharacterized protein BU24DRAFT_80986 [Aaosphaeria arxii CBS 175.79]KAF2009694.1 hypothetical protein BU24DRAFT_80986 [Aaosphaeria arxii CBS 175.79]